MGAAASFARVEPRVVIASASDAVGGPGDRLNQNRFPPACRLKNAIEYSTVFHARKVLRGRWFTVHLLPHPAGVGARLGLVVAKKLLRTAVARNLTKRLVREAFRQKRQVLPDTDFVFRLTARPGPTARHVDRVALRADIDLLIGRCVGSARGPTRLTDARAGDGARSSA